MRYKTAAALEMAVRNAAKASPQDTNRADSRVLLPPPAVPRLQRAGATLRA